MPTYDYVCSTCGTFEVYQGIKETPLAACPTCGGRVKRKIGTGGGLLFKGSGFYVTDYRSDAYQRKAKSDQAPAQPAGEAKPAGGVDPKPAGGSTGAAPASGSSGGPAASSGGGDAPSSSAPPASPPPKTGSA